MYNYLLHLNSQAKGPLLDRTLESFLINTEGAIFRYLLIMKKISQVKGQSRKIIRYFCSVLFYFKNKMIVTQKANKMVQGARCIVPTSDIKQ